MPGELERYQVVTTLGARQDLREIHNYIQERASRAIANRYLASIKAFAAELAYAPLRGRSFEQIRPGLRAIGFKHRVAIVFAVFPEHKVVEIQGFDYAGRHRRH